MIKIEVLKPFTTYDEYCDRPSITKGSLKITTNSAVLFCDATPIDEDILIKAAIDLCSEEDEINELFISTLHYFKERMGIESFSDSIQNYGGDLPEHEWKTLCSYFNLA